jgi:hypothetical protein
MPKRTKIALFIILMLSLAAQGTLFAQFQQLPTPKLPQHQVNPTARLLQDPLTLPFWEDFNLPTIDTTKWVTEGVTHSYTMAYAAPSMGVAVLDGVNALGRPYSTNLLEQGLGDQLTSQPIDLSQILTTEQNSVFLSFYWQAGGKAELPDQNDILSLDFLSATGNWVQVWEKRGDLPAEQFFFTWENINVPVAFHHSDFRFRFQSSGRKSGPFDTWLLDYIFLNKNRTSTDRNMDDRTLTRMNPRIFTKYSAIPLFDLQSRLTGNLPPVQNEFLNMANRFRAMEFTVELRDRQNGQILKKINNNTPINPVPLALERREITSNGISDFPIPTQETDYELRTYLSTGDRFFYRIVSGDTIFYPSVDFRKNDTATVVIPIRDFYAYDDGQADYSAGINQRSGMLAVRYDVNRPVFLTGISVNFTNFNQIGNVIDIMVWKELDKPPLYKKEVLIPEKSKLEEFGLFEIDVNLQVEGTFYIGFTQFTNDFIFIGLDKTFDNGAEIFYNVAGAWQQNTEVSGSLMMRPHLSIDQPYQSEAPVENTFSVYPNPVVDFLNVEGNYENLSVYDSFGRRMELLQEETDRGKIINFTGLKKGVYLLKLEKQGTQQSIRVLVK